MLRRRGLSVDPLFSHQRSAVSNQRANQLPARKIMGWRTTPSRRELTLVLFSLMIFILFYNLDTSFRLLGVDSHGSLISKLGFRKGIIGTDGRRPGGDPLEGQIFGDWQWEEGQVAGSGAEKQKGKGKGKVGEDKYGAIWVGASENQSILGEGKVSDSFITWGHNVPRTKLVKHIPGYTILDNVIMANGTLYIVTDNVTSFPTLGEIASSSDNPNDVYDWHIVDGQDTEAFGTLGGFIPGPTWISPDAEHDNHTLFSLWRTYSSLDPGIDSLGKTILPPPRRLFFPALPYYTQKRSGPDVADFPRVRSKTGIDEVTAKAAFPTLAFLTRNDWDDYAQMHVSFVFERLIVADRGAAARAASATDHDQPVWAAPIEHLETSKYWWEPVRQSMAVFFHQEAKNKVGSTTAIDGGGGNGDGSSASMTNQSTIKPVITYLSTQETPQWRAPGPKLKQAHHKLLVESLNAMGKSNGYEINIVPGDAEWKVRMNAIVRSTILIGVYGSNLADSYYMRPSWHSTIMEFYPQGQFTRDQEVAARSLGIEYTAWWSTRQMSGKTLPPVVTPDETKNLEIDINPTAIVQAIRERIEEASPIVTPE